MATVPEGAAQGILAFIKARKPDGMSDEEFNTQNLWHLKAAPLGATINPRDVETQPPISLAPAEIGNRADELASVLTFFNANKNSVQFVNSEAWKERDSLLPKTMGGKKRHIKTANKRKRGGSRKIRKSKK
jgi:hypothetical protein